MKTQINIMLLNLIFAFSTLSCVTQEVLINGQSAEDAYSQAVLLYTNKNFENSKIALEEIIEKANHPSSRGLLSLIYYNGNGATKNREYAYQLALDLEKEINFKQFINPFFNDKKYFEGAYYSNIVLLKYYTDIKKNLAGRRVAADFLFNNIKHLDYLQKKVAEMDIEFNYSWLISSKSFENNIPKNQHSKELEKSENSVEISTNISSENKSEIGFRQSRIGLVTSEKQIIAYEKLQVDVKLFLEKAIQNQSTPKTQSVSQGLWRYTTTTNDQLTGLSKQVIMLFKCQIINEQSVCAINRMMYGYEEATIGDINGFVDKVMQSIYFKWKLDHDRG